MDMDEKRLQNYIYRINLMVKKSNNKEYNAQAVAKMLEIPHNLPYNAQCAAIIGYLKSNKTDNDAIKEILQLKKKLKMNDKDTCELLVKILYSLFNPRDLPNKAPIKISEKRYRALIKKSGDEEESKLSKKEMDELDNALQTKYCYCVKKLYLRNLFNKYIKSEDTKYNPYGTCMYSIYKKRNIEPPSKVSKTCKDKFTWFR